MFHTRDHFVPLDIYIYIYILSSFSNSTSFSIQPMRAPPTLVTISHVLFVLFVLFFLPFEYHQTLVALNEERLFLVPPVPRVFYQWHIMFGDASSNLQSGRNRLLFRQSPYFRSTGGTTFHRKRKRESRAMWIQIYTVVRENTIGKFWWKNN